MILENQSESKKGEAIFSINLDDKIDFGNPHAFLGPHGTKIWFWRPGYLAFTFDYKGNKAEAIPSNKPGLFFFEANEIVDPFSYRIEANRSDPYAFWPTIGPKDEYFFNHGVHYQLYDLLGAHPCKHQGVDGVRFSVWAPNAINVFLVGEFNFWDKKMHPMRRMGQSGIFELFIPQHPLDFRYQFGIETNDGYREKADPMAFQREHRSSVSSLVKDIRAFKWSDQTFEEAKQKQDIYTLPLNIYEVHLGSWSTKVTSYLEAIEHLLPYVKEMGYTHIEFMPIAEYPFDESWGYQCSGYFAPTSRYGSLDDFKAMINAFHLNNIGVIVDWVPAHFPEDSHALAVFDGTHLYEHEAPHRGWHPHWQTKLFNYGRKEVSNFLIASALYWLKELHIDGLRVDAVASMLYLDYGREESSWEPNSYGGNIDLEAVDFLKHLNSQIADQLPGRLLIAEDSSDYQGVTRSIKEGGLGFHFKWKMGWMNDTLTFFSKEPIYRKYHHNDITFGMFYHGAEHYLLPLSHDEVVHLKKSLLSKMPGDEFQRFANLRLLMGHMFCMPGKKLAFMGYELGEWDEWSEKRELNWSLLQYLPHKGVHEYIKALNWIYRGYSALWSYDEGNRGFEWVDFSDYDRSVFIYLRTSDEKRLLVVDHMTPGYHGNYVIWLKGVQSIKELLNSDDLLFGGSGKTNLQPKIIYSEENDPIGVEIQLAPLANMIFEVVFEDDEERLRTISRRGARA